MEDIDTSDEDYCCGSYNFENRKTRECQIFNTPYTGLHQRNSTQPREYLPLQDDIASVLCSDKGSALSAWIPCLAAPAHSCRCPRDDSPWWSCWIRWKKSDR